MPASSELVALCHAQASLLVQTLGTSVAAVYLTRELSDSSQRELIPVVMYPEEPEQWPVPQTLRLPQALDSTRLLSSEDPHQPEDWDFPLHPVPDSPQTAPLPTTALTSTRQQRLVLPLIHNEVVLGLLVVGREDRPWSSQEETQLEQVAQTLAIACVLDQRSQWLEHMNRSQRSLQAQQHNTLANLLHQIRNPLTTLRTLGKLLLKRFRPDDGNYTLANSIVRETERMEDLLLQFDDAIDLGEAALDQEVDLATPGVQLPALLPAQDTTAVPLGNALVLQPCWIAEVLQPLVTSAQAVAQAKSLRLSADLPTELPPVMADAPALREVLSNLLDNALKYTPAGGEVWVQLRRDSTQPLQTVQQVWVSDSGPGIPATDQEHLFERHFRGVQAQGKLPGSGLGLAIAHDLVTQMQGQLQVYTPALIAPRSRAATDHPGTTFVVTLPEQAGA